ncbi:MAG: hypothetical protein ACK5JD_14605 [Mangrovibacterium sp.]
MRKLKYILLFLLSAGILNSCLVSDDTSFDSNDKGANVAGFESSRTTIAAIADGDEYDFKLKVKITGPTWSELDDDVTMTVAADASSTAIEGTHFRIDNPNVTLSADDNYLGFFTITMLTEGIITPLEESPVIVLKVTSASGEEMVLNSGKTIAITMNYACPSFLAGTYAVTTEYTNSEGIVTMLSWTETITATGIGEYRTEHVGHWSVGALDPGTPGFTFTDVCGVITVEEQNLADYYSNIVTGTAFGTVDSETGNLYIEYSICYNGSCRLYKSTYIKQ